MSITSPKRNQDHHDTYELSFSNKDMYGVDAPHNDALVLKVNINTFDVRRVIIDPGSSSEIMYHSLFKTLDWPASQMKNADMPLFSFSGEAVWQIAIVEVPVRISVVKKTV